MDWQDECDNEKFIEFLSRVVRDNEDRVLAGMYADLENSTHLNTKWDFPLPNTWHPGLVRHVAFVREHANEVVRIHKPTTSAVMAEEPYDPRKPEVIDTFIMTSKHVVAPMPFTGLDARLEQMFYIWEVWSDDLGRHIAGDAKIQTRYLV